MSLKVGSEEKMGSQEKGGSEENFGSYQSLKSPNVEVIKSGKS